MMPEQGGKLLRPRMSCVPSYRPIQRVLAYMAEAMTSYLQARVRGRASKSWDSTEMRFGARGGVQSSKAAAECTVTGSS